MGLFGKKKEPAQDSSEEKKCFNCGKEIKGDGFTQSHGRYCCEKCCSKEGEAKGEKCEFC